MNLERFEALIGKDKLEVIKKLNILIIGIGGVGGFTLESLVRSGVENITIIDFDKIETSNLNRQILTNNNNIGSLKVVEALKRYETINSSLNLICINNFISEDNINLIDFSKYDYIVDTCDTVKTKVLLINNALLNNKKVISSMGTAKKMDASKLYITTLDKTSYDPLAKVLRKNIDKNKQKKVVVVTSKEETIKTEVLGSNSFVPATAGLLITSYIINDAIR